MNRLTWRSDASENAVNRNINLTQKCCDEPTQLLVTCCKHLSKTSHLYFMVTKATILNFTQTEISEFKTPSYRGEMQWF